MSLTVRKVDIDFSQAKIHWNPKEPEYAQLLNGLSSGFPLLEPFLIKVVRQARELAPEHMKKDIDLFIAQEGRHFKQHAKFNQLLYDAGYDLDPVMKELQAGYERCLTKKSLKFNLGYCDGFETFGPMLSYFFFQHPPGMELMKDWDEPTVYLWMWHLCEEFEHRAVCYELYKALYGGYSSYLYRCWMMWYSMIQLFGYGLKAYFRIIKKDRESMSFRQRMASRVRFIKVFWKVASFIGGHMIKLCMRRDYDPRALHEPEPVTLWRKETSERYGILESA
jgi:predicted metal-dependent hydrolase